MKIKQSDVIGSAGAALTAAGLTRSNQDLSIFTKPIVDQHEKGGCSIMKTLVGGAVAAALGLVGLGFWWKEFLIVLGGTIPAALLLGGGLAIYLGFDEMKDTW